MAFVLASSAFANGDAIPRHHTADGQQSSPELAWSGAPRGTRSYVLIVHDPDTPRGDVTHWLLWDIPGSRSALPEDAGRSPIGVAGRNSHGDTGFLGPSPPPGDPPHRYYFELYALDVDRLGLPWGATRGAVETALKPHMLATTRLMGLYQRAKTEWK
ncbi:MAG TPA: YbhB/YbcL family Raf kinase inhibitor-like protein [Opitutaceae bacterium]|nr:YbhB/YbcL family Raf kinase inhibitor-like protein [Opitutaceae bacterium]